MFEISPSRTILDLRVICLANRKSELKSQSTLDIYWNYVLTPTLKQRGACSFHKIINASKKNKV